MTLSINNEFDWEGIQVKISLPSNYDPNQTYPAILLNDGNLDFLSSLSESVILVGLTLENLVSMDPELIIYVTSDRNKKLDEKAVELMKANAVLESVPAIKNQKIMTISYDELMDYGPAVIDSLEKINDFINK